MTQPETEILSFKVKTYAKIESMRNKKLTPQAKHIHIRISYIMKYSS